jgi:hypothetical protein
MEVSDYDWRLYRSLLPKWQERYMAKLNKEYIALLSENNNPSTNFWKLKKESVRMSSRQVWLLILGAVTFL